MTETKLEAAVEVLVDQLNSQMREVTETKRTINGLRRRMGEQPMFPDEDEHVDGISAIRSDQFYGKPLATAVQMFLERRKQACAADEILRGLEQGGFDFRALDWGENDRVRILAISLAKNNLTFHKLPNGTFGIRGWYDDAILKRAERKVQETPHSRNGKPRKRPTAHNSARKAAQKETPSADSTAKSADSEPKPGGQSE